MVDANREQGQGVENESAQAALEALRQLRLGLAPAHAEFLEQAVPGSTQGQEVNWEAFFPQDDDLQRLLTNKEQALGLANKLANLIFALRQEFGQLPNISNNLHVLMKLKELEHVQGLTPDQTTKRDTNQQIVDSSRLRIDFFKEVLSKLKALMSKSQIVSSAIIEVGRSKSQDPQKSESQDEALSSNIIRSRMVSQALELDVFNKGSLLTRLQSLIEAVSQS